MTLQYKLEYNTPSGGGDDAVYIQLRTDPAGYYRFRTGKEDYETSGNTDSFANGLFSVDGVEEISVTAYRVWIMKSPVYDWTEVNSGVLGFLQTFFAEGSLEPIPGSASLDGSGLRLDSDDNRRSL